MSKSRDIADSAATINYIDGLTSDAQTQLDGKAGLSSPTFSGTVTATAFSGDGSGLTGVDSLPSQTGNDGLFLTTDGSTASWAEAGGGAWELISTTTLSGSSYIADITSGIDSTYDNYVFVISDLQAGDRVYFQWYKTGSLVSGATYNYIEIATSVAPKSSQTKVQVGYPSVGSLNGIIYLLNANSTSSRGSGYLSQAQAVNGMNFSSGNSNDSGAVTGLRFITESYTTLSSGTIRLYGIAQ